MKIYCCQFDIQWENKKANFAKVLALLSSERLEVDSLVVLPELFATGFSMNVAQIAEQTDSITEQFLSDTARQYRVFILGGMAGRDKRGFGRNEAALFSPLGQFVTRYCKVHPFTLGGESKHYVPGDQIIVTPCHGFAMAPFICYDLRFPELFRFAMRRGANLFTVIANWPVMRIDHWVKLLQARAIENQAYVVGVNRCGTDPELTYNGRSIVVDPSGEIIADAGDGEQLMSADLNLDTVNKYRFDLPFLKDVRPDYDKLVV
jgi:omega-amidase